MSTAVLAGPPHLTCETSERSLAYLPGPLTPPKLPILAVNPKADPKIDPKVDPKADPKADPQVGPSLGR